MNGAETPEIDRSRYFGFMSPEVVAMLLLAGGAFAGVFYKWLAVQHRFSFRYPEDWGHAYLVPVISAYLLWQRRADFASARARAFWPALCVFLLGLVSYVFFLASRLPGAHFLQGTAMVGTLEALVLLIAGPEIFRSAFIPIAFLAFAITVPERFMLMVTAPLQLIASEGAWIVLSVVGAVAGFTVDVGGNIITIIGSDGTPLPPLNVAEACAGMRMVVAFVALGAAVGVMSCRHWWQRSMLVLLSLPVAILLNVTRVAVLGLASLFNPGLATGEAHSLIGTLLLVPGLLLFMGIVWVLGRIVTDEPQPKDLRP